MMSLYLHMMYISATSFETSSNDKLVLALRKLTEFLSLVFRYKMSRD